MNPIEAALRRLVATTSAPPADVPVDQLLALADTIAKERQPMFEELSALLRCGARLTDAARALVEQLHGADRTWRDRLDEARARIDAQGAQARAPRGRISAYQTR